MTNLENYIEKLDRVEAELSRVFRKKGYKRERPFEVTRTDTAKAQEHWYYDDWPNTVPYIEDRSFNTWVMTEAWPEETPVGREVVATRFRNVSGQEFVHVGLKDLRNAVVLADIVNKRLKADINVF